MIQAEIGYQEQMRLEKELGDIGDADIETTTKNNVPKIDPLKAYVDPWRPLFDGILFSLRLTSNIITWEDSYISFIFTLSFAVLTIVSFLIPWKWVILVTSRFAAYICMGPWNRFIDIKYVKPFELTEKDLIDFGSKLRKDLHITNRTITEAARAQREEAIKIRDMKKKKFGKHVVKVPKRNVARFRSTALPQSSAVPYNRRDSFGKIAINDFREHIVMSGQRISGCMIPKVQPLPLTIAPTGKLMNDECLESPGVISTNSIAALVFSIAAGAVLTAFGVPVMSNAAQLIWGNI